MLSSIRRSALLLLCAAVAACATDRTPTATPAEESSAVEMRRLEAQAQAERTRLAGLAELARQQDDSVRPNLSLLGGIGSTLGTLTGTVTDVLTSPLLVCSPLDFAYDVRIIGPAGGTLQIGPHRLVIPAGALEQNTVISGQIPLLSVTPSVTLSPHGLRFDRAAQLTLSYEHCLLDLGSTRSVVYTDDDLNILEWQQSKDSRTKRVTGFIWHFSRYAVARGSNYAVAW